MNNVNTTVNTARSGIEKIIEIMRRDMVYIPKAVMRCSDVYDESKMMFSVLFTDCLKQLAESGRSAMTVDQMMKERLHELSLPEICFECFCTKSKAEIVRRETLHLIDHINISECLKEVR